MKKSFLPLYAVLGVIIVTASCERPSSPNFTLETRNTVPLIKERSYEFIGGKNALIDSTSADFQDLFEIAGDGSVRIVQEIDFEIGDFGSAIPEINVDAVTIRSQIGEIEIDDFDASFSSRIGEIEAEPKGIDPENAEVGTFNAQFSGTGTATYQQITGNDPNTVPPGTPIIAAQSNPVLVELNTGQYQSAVIESGGITVDFQNDLGFNISQLQVRLLSDGNQVSSTAVENNINHGSEREFRFDFSQGEVLETPISVELVVSWGAQNTQASAGNLVITEAQDDNLVVSRAVANIPQQVINPETPALEINTATFVYAVLDNNADANTNRLTVSVRNTSQLPITNSTFNGTPILTLRNSEGTTLGTPQALVVNNNPSINQIGAGQTGVAVIDLSGSKLTKVFNYTLDIGTQGGNGLTVDSEDFFEISAQTSDLSMSEANTDVDPQDNIELEDTQAVDGDFVDAEVDQGSLVIRFTNRSNIPLTIDNLRFFNAQAFRAKNTGRFFNEGSEIGEISNVVIPALSDAERTIDISGRGISRSVGYTGTASSTGSATAVLITSDDFIEIEIIGSVTLNSANATLDPQDFFTSGEIELDDDEFVLSQSSHFVEIQSGVLNFSRIQNSIDLDIDSLIISFPDIRKPGNGFGLADSLVLRFDAANNNKIRRRAANQIASDQFSLAGHRIYAMGNKIRYHVKAYTENTRSAVGADTVRTVNSTDEIEVVVDIENLKIDSAVGRPVVKSIALNDIPEGVTSGLELYNDDVAEITEIEDLAELSKRVSEIKFFNPTLNLTYNTNIGVDAFIYAAILGISEQGNEVMLTGKPGSGFDVAPGDTVGPFFKNGVQIPNSELIRFRVDGATNFGQLSQDITLMFTSQNTNVDDFLSNLPTKIRFVGKALVNPDNNNGFIVDPVEFNTSMGIDVPLNFATADNPGVSVDTLKLDLSNLPKEGDDVTFKSARLILNYENALPLDLDLRFLFLDQNEAVVTQAPLPGRPDDGPYRIAPAAVDPTSRFSITPNKGVLIFNLNEEQLRQLHRTRNLELTITFQSTNGEEVKIRARDFVKISLNAEFSTQATFN